MSTKDSENYYHTHPFPIPKRFAEALHNLSDHHDALLTGWYFLNADECMQFKWSKPRELTNKRDKDLNASSDEPKFFFALDPEGRRRGFLPEKAVAGLTANGLEVNSLRHFFCTELLQIGCPVEVLRALMSHWRIGEEPWGRFSGLDPVTFREIAIRCIDGLLDRIDFRPVTSPLMK